MNFEEWFKITPIVDENYTEEEVARLAWDSCKNEVLKIIRLKYPKTGLHDLVYEDGWDTACMSIEEKVEQL